MGLWLRRALITDGRRVGTLLALGTLLRNCGRRAAALVAFRRAVAVDPNHRWARLELGHDLVCAGRVHEADAELHELLRRHPDFTEGRLAWAGVRMLMGDLAAGFAGFEHRYAVEGFPWRERHRGIPRWDGAPLAGRTLLVHAERDFGDSIQYIRYVPLLIERGERVVVEVQPELVRLFAHSLPGVPVVAHDGGVPAVACQAPLPSLPALFGTRLDNVPARVPYLRSPALAPALPAAAGQRRVGLVWASRPGSINFDSRYCPLAALAPLLEVPGCRFFSLQMGPAADELTRLGPAGPTDLRPSIGDFADTAAIVEALDLVICIDTAVAHLAGALGRPVWLLLPLLPAYRWLLERADSPWYPSMRLFRQRLNRWDEAIADVVRACADWARAGP